MFEKSYKGEQIMNIEERKSMISKGLIKVGFGLITFPFNFIAGLIVMYLGLDDLSTIDNNGRKENLSSHILDIINNKILYKKQKKYSEIENDLS